jgi:serine/threonine-protein kinase SRPK3
MSIFITRPRASVQSLLFRIPVFRQLSSSPDKPVNVVEPAHHLINFPIEEEELAGNRLAEFHPTKPGEVLDERFKTVAKLGFGTSSTVWLAENLRL